MIEIRLLRTMTGYIQFEYSNGVERKMSLWNRYRIMILSRKAMTMMMVLIIHVCICSTLLFSTYYTFSFIFVNYLRNLIVWFPWKHEKIDLSYQEMKSVHWNDMSESEKKNGMRNKIFFSRLKITCEET